MDNEQYKKVCELHQKLTALQAINTELDMKAHPRYLSYAYIQAGNVNMAISPLLIKPIQDILHKHNKMIRKEINEEIKKLKAELKTL